MAERTTYKGFPVFTEQPTGTGGDFVNDISIKAADEVESLQNTQFNKSYISYENVRDYGAVGDGVTNDTAAILAAYQAALAPSGSRAVFFPTGEFLTDKITVLDEDFLTFGNGRESVVKSRTGDHVFHITNGCYGTNFRNMCIRGQGKTGNSGIGIYVDALPRAMSYCTWQDLFIEYFGRHGIALGPTTKTVGTIDGDAVYSCTFTKIQIENTGSHCFRVLSAAPSVTWNDCSFFYRPTGSGHPDTEDGRPYCFVCLHGYVTLNAINGDTFDFEDTGGLIYLNNCRFSMENVTCENQCGVGIYLKGCNGGIIANSMISNQNEASDPPNLAVAIYMDHSADVVFLKNMGFASNTAWLNDQPVHIQSSNSVVVEGRVPSQVYEWDGPATRDIGRVRDYIGYDGKHRYYVDYTYFPNLVGGIADFDTSARAPTLTALASSDASTRRGYVLADVNNGWMRDDHGVYAGAGVANVSQVFYGGGSGSRKWAFVDNISNILRASINIGNLTANGETGFAVTPWVNQGTTLGYTAFNVDVTQFATGSGTKRLANLAADGDSKFSVSNEGVTVIKQRVTSGVFTCTQSGGVFAINALLGNEARILISDDDQSVGSPTDPVSGQRLLFRIIVDANPHTNFTWHGVFRLAGGSEPDTSTMTSGDYFYIEFVYDGSNWNELYRSAVYP